MTDPTLAALTRENAYLKLRNAQLQEDVTALAAEGERLTQILERLHGRTSAVGPGPLGARR
jgi:ABC-type phosphate transport system auxiliary subunit